MLINWINHIYQYLQKNSPNLVRFQKIICRRSCAPPEKKGLKSVLLYSGILPLTSIKTDWQVCGVRLSVGQIAFLSLLQSSLSDLKPIYFGATLSMIAKLMYGKTN